jgi:hypothetical protein
MMVVHMPLKGRLKSVEARLTRVEEWAKKVQNVLLISMEFNPFEECCQDEYDVMILKFLVKHGVATTTQIAKYLQKELRSKHGQKPTSRFAVFHRLRKIKERAVEREHPDLLRYHPEKRGKLFRFWEVNPLLTEILREQAEKTDEVNFISL